MNQSWTTWIDRRGMTGRRGIALALLVLIVTVSACAGGDDESSGDTAGGGADMGMTEAEAPKGRALSVTSGGSGGGSSYASGPAAASGEDALVADTSSSTGGGTAARLPSVGPSVIKTAQIDVGVADDEVDDAINEAIAVAGRYGGFVLSSQLGRRDSGGTLTMRIPASRFETALTELEALGKVRRENISGEDVGQEFVDLQARLRNWESQEAVLLKLMDRAASVTDTIRVQNELSRVQLEIEQLRGRLTYLRDQTSFGTITAAFGPLSAPSPDAPSRFAQAWSRALDLMQSFVAGMIVTLGVLVPLAAIALLLYLLFRGLRPRLSA